MVHMKFVNLAQHGTPLIFFNHVCHAPKHGPQSWSLKRRNSTSGVCLPQNPMYRWQNNKQPLSWGAQIVARLIS